MRPASIRLVVSDLDGTLLSSDRRLSQRTRAALTAWMASGSTFAIATARARRHLAALGIDATVGAVAICVNGAVVVDLSTGAILEASVIDPAIAVPLVRELEDAIPGCVFAAELVATVGRDPRYRSVETVPPDHAEPGVALAARGATKLMMQHPELTASVLLGAVTDLVGGRVTVTRSTDRFVELGPLGVDKGSGLRSLRERLGMPRSDVAYVGDMLNDLPMFAEAGWRVAVGNAHPDVLADADEITASNDDDGVAMLLEALLATATAHG